MSDYHFIATCKLDILYHNEQKARDLQNRISRIFHSEMSRVIGDVCDALVTEGRLLSVEKLEIDLGEVNEEALGTELPMRLKAQLLEKLGELLTLPASPLVQQASQHPEEENYLEALSIFLKSGHIPWKYQRITASFGAFLDRIFTDYATGLLPLIRGHITNRTFLERLIKQFGEENIRRLIRLLAPHEADIVIETTRQILWIEEKERVLALSRTSFELSIWELVLTYLVQDRGSYFNTKDFLRSVIRRLAMRYQVDFSDYLRQLHIAVHYLALYHSFRYGFPRLLEEIYQEAAEEHPVTADPRENAEAAALHFYLEYGYLSGKHALVSQESLQSFISGDQEALQQTIAYLQQHRHHEHSRHRVLLLMEEPGAKKVVAYLEPAGQEVIFDFAEELQKKQETGQLQVPVASKTFRLIKWDFILYTLLNNRGSVFNTKVFILDTLQAMANRYAQDFDLLLRLFLSSFPIRSETGVHSNLLAAVRLLRVEYPQKQDTATGASPGLTDPGRLLSRKSRFGTREENQLLTQIEAIYSSSDRHLKDALKHALTDEAAGISNLLQQRDLVQKLLRLSPSLKSVIHAYQATEKKVLRERVQLTADIHQAMELLIKAPADEHRSRSGDFYLLLLRWLQASLPIPQSLKKKLRSEPLRKALILSETERAVLERAAPNWLKDVLGKLPKRPDLQADGLAKEAYLSLLQHYVTHDRMPWWASSNGDNPQTIDQVVRHLLQHRSSSTREHLVGMLQDEKRRQVLIRSLTPARLTALILHLSDLQPATLRYFLLLTGRFNESHPLSTARRSTLSAGQWQLLFGAVLGDRRAPFNLRDFFAKTFSGLAAHAGMNYPDVLDTFLLLNSRNTGAESREFNSVLETLVSEAKNGRKPDVSEQAPDDLKKRTLSLPPRNESGLRHLQHLLQTITERSGTTPAQIRQVEPLLHQIAPEDQDELLHIFQDLRWSNETWTTFRTRLGEPALVHLFNLLTRDRPFIRNYLSDWEKAISLLFPKKRASTKRIFYELTLRYLMVHRTMDKHEWFAMVLSQFLAGSTKATQKKLVTYFSQQHLLFTSTIRLSVQKWQATSPAHAGKPAPVSGAPGPVKPPRQVTETTPTGTGTEKEEIPADYWLQNCGLTLIWPFMERYFSLLEMLEDRAFKSPEAAYRGVHLLQFLATGKEGYPEYRLILNKILCGVQVAQPILKEVQLTDHEKRLSEELLKGVIQNWSVLGNTSVEGLRSTFLMREGILKKMEDFDQLYVESGSFDVLIDKIPWSYSTVKLPWMNKPIHVQWR